MKYYEWNEIKFRRKYSVSHKLHAGEYEMERRKKWRHKFITRLLEVRESLLAITCKSPSATRILYNIQGRCCSIVIYIMLYFLLVPEVRCPYGMSH